MAAGPQLQSTVRVRPEQVIDYGPIEHLHTQAFGQPVEARLVARIRHSNAYVADLSLVAEVQQQIVGHILFSYGQLVNHETWPVLVLAPLAVLPQYQSQGIGTQLIKTGLRVAKSLGNSLVSVLGDPDYYARFGFQPASTYGIRHPFGIPDAALLVKLLSLHYDPQPGELRYPSAFNDILQEATHADSHGL